MTQEEKDLLLQDLSARLPYGVMVDVQGGEFNSYKYPYQLTAVSKFGLESFCKVYHPIYTLFGVPNVENVKPFLRSMSSMTEEEQKELEKIIDGILGYKARNYFHSEDDYKWNTLYEAIDWLNAHHFDYRGLIPMGLALEAKPGMYNN